MIRCCDAGALLTAVWQKLSRIASAEVRVRACVRACMDGVRGGGGVQRLCEDLCEDMLTDLTDDGFDG